MSTEEKTARITPEPQGRASPPDAPAAGSMISRFIVLGPLGAGGMGIVVGAYDPALDRKVAIKLVRPDVLDGEHREERTARLLREAQAIARVADRNVIAVHEVGAFGDQVYIAMELVDGEPLSRWLEAPRPLREVLGAFAAAARGLEAVHAAGLVHRDFKPENVLVGRDGRVLLADFGVVALAGAGADGKVVGTPAYMAPEQRAGGPVDPRADQYAFCIALGAALDRTGNARPAWLRPLLARGLSEKPADRHPSMAPIAERLERGPRGGRALIVAGIFAAAAVAVLGIRLQPQPLQPCRGLDAPLAGVWDAAARGRLGAAFAAAGGPLAAATFERVAAGLDAYTADWLRMRTDACLATAVRKEQSPELLDLRMFCLERRLGQVAALTSALGRVDAARLPRALPAVLELDSIAECADGATLAAAVPRPSDPVRRAQVAALDERLDRLAALDRTGQRRAALAAAPMVVGEARVVGHAPSRARALTLLASMQANAGQDPSAAAQAAMIAAAEARDDTLLVRNLAVLVGYLDARGAGDQTASLQTALLAAAERAGRDFLRAMAHFAIGSVVEGTGDLVAAEKEFGLALALRERTVDADSYQLIPALAALARVRNRLERLDDAQVLLDRGLLIAERHLGPDSIHAAGLLNDCGNNRSLRHDREGALQAFQRMLAAVEKSYGEDNPRVAVPLANVASALRDLGRHDEALAAYRRSLALFEKAYGPEHPYVASVVHGIGETLRLKGDLAAARVELERALALSTKVLEPDHPDLAVCLVSLAALELATGDPDAGAHARAALAIREKRFPADHALVAESRAQVEKTRR